MIAAEELATSQIQPNTQIKQNDEQEFQRPQFLSKAQRQANQQKEEEAKLLEKTQRERQIQQVRKEYSTYNQKRQISDHLHQERERERERDREREREKEREKEKEKERKEVENQRSRSRSQERDHSRYVTSNTRATVPQKFQGVDKEMLSIKIHYLGLNKEKKKVLKPSEKFKNIFNFEWDSSEDTSMDPNPIYQQRMEPNLLFGRGFQAGFDIGEQRAKAVKYENLITRYDPLDEGEVPVIEEKKKDQPIKKDIYDITESDHWSLKNHQQMTERDWRIFREDNDIIIKGGRVPYPIRYWNEAVLPQIILDAISRLGYAKPTPIQMQTIPIGLERKDLIGIAPTGSGKSAAFLVPLINYLLTLPIQDDMTCKDGPYALILTPSRELAIQIEEEFQVIMLIYIVKRLSIGTNIRSFVVVGGRREEDQAFHLKKGIELLIGTPGRIKDALMKKFLVLDQCSWAILDEADKMIDMGFEGDVNFILDSITTTLKSPNDAVAEIQEKLARQGQEHFRVTHLFSATMPVTVEKLAKKYLRAFCFISIGEPGGGKKDIEQRIEMISEANKKKQLLHLLQTQEPPIIIFANQKKSVEVLTKIIEKNGWNAVFYHGGKTQQQREAAVEGFKNRQYDILVATDIASRGLHVEGVKAVINFDAPKNISDFIHRTGRTGRAGMKGLAITFLTNADEELFYDLKEFLLKNDQQVPPELDSHPAARVKPGSMPDNLPRRKQVIYAS